MLVAIIMLYNKPAVTVVVEDTKKIEQLRNEIDILNKKYISLQTAYDNKQTVLIDNTVKQNKQDAKTIINIPRLNNPQRDSMWTVLNTSKDSIPGGYWGILKQKTGGRSPKDLQIQGSLQGQP